MNGGGVFLNKNILSKAKKGIIVGILVCSGLSNVRAITANEVTYNNNGVEENLTETLDTLYIELKQYKTGGNVTPSEMLEGSSGYSKGVLVTGSIKKKEATTYTPGVNNITITKGQYLNGNQVIKGDTNLKSENIKSGVSLFGINGTYTNDANAAANQILSGKTAYVKGNKVTGTMANKSGATVEASTITSDDNYTYLTIPETGYYNTSSKVKVNNEKIISNIDTYPDTLYAMSSSMPNGNEMTCDFTLKNPNINKYKRMKYIANSQNGANTFVIINGAWVNGTGYINVSDSVSVKIRTASSDYKAPSCTLYWST